MKAVIFGIVRGNIFFCRYCEQIEISDEIITMNAEENQWWDFETSNEVNDLFNLSAFQNQKANILM